jgi:transcription elongation GreA/GreB family factor
VFIKNKIEELRMRLLDLSNRNSLLNFKHSERALTHIRIIDELPDFLFGALLQGNRLTFKPLPEPGDEPQDEKTEKFQSAFREATIIDEEYLEKIAELENKDDSFDALATIERDLKNRVRKSLGMIPIDDIKPLSNSQWARENDLEPKYDMPIPANDCQLDKHNDEFIQTLLKPKELRHKLSGLRRYVNTDMSEAGVPSFYAAFGFLERFDSDHSEKPVIAPLLLLQLDHTSLVEKKKGAGEKFVSIKASGEEPQYNPALAEKLKEFGLELPELNSEDTPESYMQKVAGLIKNQKRWRVRRFITFGRFQFARIVMHRDLDPDNWPENGKIENSELIKNIFGGQGENAGSSGDDHASIYNIDEDPNVEKVAPVLIMDADSSQHSAIVDAMKGKNLVIQGPPGTGKSQTITNLIANALANKKKILFVAEKMAALNVVYSRLQSVGLGDFCLELHSTKSKLKDVKEGLAKTIENRVSATRPNNLAGRIAEIKEAKTRLRKYSDALNFKIGESGKTIHDFLWGEQRYRNAVQDMPVSIKRIRIINSMSYTNQKLENLCDELSQLASLEIDNEKYIAEGHPWAGVNIVKASSLISQEIIQAFEECAEVVHPILGNIKLIEKEFDWITTKTIAEWRETHQICQKIQSFKGRSVDFGLLKILHSKDSKSATIDLLNNLESYDQALANIRKKIKDPAYCLNSFSDISKLCSEARLLGIENNTAQDIDELIRKQDKQISQWDKTVGSFNNIALKVFGSSEGELKMDTLRLLFKVFKFLSEVERDVLFLRHDEAIKESNKPLIENGISHQKDLNDQEKSLAGVCDLNYSFSENELNEAIYELSTVNFFSFLMPKYYRARKIFRSISLSSTKLSSREMAIRLKELTSFKKRKVAFEQDIRYQQLAGVSFDGLQTNFEGLKKINAWAIKVRKEFNGLDEAKDRIKKFLLSADISEIDTVKDETSHNDIEALSNNVSSIDADSLASFCSKLKSSLERKKDLCLFLKNNQSNSDLTFCMLENLLEGSIQEAITCQKNIHSNHDSFLDSLGSIFNGMESDRKVLKEMIALSDHVEALNLPDFMHSSIYSSELFQLAKKLTSFLEGLIAKIDKAENAMQTAQKVSHLDIREYLGAEAIPMATIEGISKAVDKSLGDKEALYAQINLKAFMDKAQSQSYIELLKILKQEGLNYQKAPDIFKYLYFRTICDNALSENEMLDIQAPFSLESVREKFKELDRTIIKMYSQELAYKLTQQEPPPGNSSGNISTYTEMGLIYHQALKEKARSIPLRSLVRRAGRALQCLKPCFLMSPLSVARYIDTHGIKFDLMIIDEASQMRPEDALGAIGRSKQIVIVGDQKQLPPTTFFNKQAISDEDYDDEDKIDNESILDLSLGRFRPTRDLLWHYRSRHESLIKFSNYHFYKDRLIVFPSPEERSENFGVHYNYIGGTYNAGCNPDEAKAIAIAARKFMYDYPDKSLGIAAMNVRQRELIEVEMDMLFSDDNIVDAYREKWEQERGGLEPFFIKNLESVQGDERDVIFISTVYGPDKSGRVMQRFGPINGKFGHRRLNVLFTRAKHSLILFTSLKPNEIIATESSAQGLRAFKGYLEYAASGKLDAGHIGPREPDSDFEICVMEKLESIGCEVVPQVGVKGYFIDLGVKHPDYPYGFMMGIECDGAAYHSCKSARDRDRIRQDVLEDLGWKIYRIWSTDWFHNPTKEFEKLKIYIECTLREIITEREKREQERLSCIAELQQGVQEDLFSGVDEEISKVEDSRSAESSIEEQSQINEENRVNLFDEVSYQFVDDLEQVLRTVTIVPTQSDPVQGFINQRSAVGRALLGSEAGEEVEVSLPDGDRIAIIKKIIKPCP